MSGLMIDHREWVAGVTGGSVTRFARVSAGRSRGTWVVDVEGPGDVRRELVVRRDTGDGPLSGTEISLRREAVVYRALARTSIAIPRLVAVSPDDAALLVERAPGSEDLAGLPAHERDAVMEAFIAQLAELHRIDVGRLDLPGFARPVAAEEHATCDLDVWQRVFERHVHRPAPLWRLVFGWLRGHAPAVVARTVLCHGDVGPGNFLFVGREVTAVLDWEFAHVGDPMDDVAWLTIRGHHLFDCGDPHAQLRLYQDLAGLVLDPDSVRYYQLFVLLRMAVACLVALDRRAGRMDVSTYFALLPVLSTLATRMLADLEGVELAESDPPPSAVPSPRAEVLDAVGCDIGTVMLPEMQSPEARSRALGTSLLIAHLRTADGLAPVLDAEELDELGAVLGASPRSVPAGLAALDDAIRADAGADLAGRVRYLARAADRQVAVWPMVAALAHKPLVSVTP